MPERKRQPEPERKRRPGPEPDNDHVDPFDDMDEIIDEEQDTEKKDNDNGQ